LVSVSVLSEETAGKQHPAAHRDEFSHPITSNNRSLWLFRYKRGTEHRTCQQHLESRQTNSCYLRRVKRETEKRKMGLDYKAFAKSGYQGTIQEKI